MSERTLSQVYKELVSSPFFPLLFMGKAAETAATTFTDVPPVVAFTVMAVVATLLWAVSDSVDVEVDKDKIL